MAGQAVKSPAQQRLAHAALPYPARGTLYSRKTNATTEPADVFPFQITQLPHHLRLREPGSVEPFHAILPGSLPSFPGFPSDFKPAHLSPALGPLAPAVPFPGTASRLVNTVPAVSILGGLPQSLEPA